MDTSFFVAFEDSPELLVCSGCGIRTSVSNRKRVQRADAARRAMVGALLHPTSKSKTTTPKVAVAASDNSPVVLTGDAALLHAIRGVLAGMSLAELKATALANEEQIGAATGELERLLKTQHIIEQIIAEKQPSVP